MIRRWLSVLVVGCGSPQIQVRMGEVSQDPGMELAKCAPATRVTVTDAAGAPVAGALVFVRQLEHASCPSAGPTTPLYTTAPVRTDSHGIATTCDPATFYQDNQLPICPHHRDAATIVVLAGNRAAQLAPPFSRDVHAVLAPCADLLAADPGVPCAK